MTEGRVDGEHRVPGEFQWDARVAYQTFSGLSVGRNGTHRRKVFLPMTMHELEGARGPHCQGYQPCDDVHLLPRPAVVEEELDVMRSDAFACGREDAHPYELTLVDAEMVFLL